MPIALTVGLGKFISGLRYKDIPKEIIPTMHTGFADCVGVIIAGAREPAPQLLQTMLAPKGDEATLLFNGSRASAPEAAWINGTAAHAIDFDDVAMGMWGHPSAVLVPAILAEAEAIDASGEEMLLAYAVGYETWAELVRRDRDLYLNKGWHPTGLFGALGAAAACASLLKLDTERAAIAIAISASQAAGLASNWGTMTKPFHAGRAAHAGVVSARLAKIGFTASLDALERPPGFLAAISPAGRIDVESPIEAGIDWKLLRNGLHIKKYPLCFATHRALDGIFDLLRANEVDASEVSRVTVSTCPRGVLQLRYSAPQIGLEAKFSMEFAMACALLARRAGLAELSDDFVRRPDVQALMKRVVVKADEREDPAVPGWAIYDQVTVETSKGHRLDSAHITKVRGGPEYPVRPDELWAKFESCIEAGRADVPTKKLFDSLMSLNRLPHIRQLPGLAVA
jgi:2-methylcitrate dehydratase PrpD